MLDWLATGLADDARDAWRRHVTFCLPGSMPRERDTHRTPPTTCVGRRDLPHPLYHLTLPRCGRRMLARTHREQNQRLVPASRYRGGVCMARTTHGVAGIRTVAVCDTNRRTAGATTVRTCAACCSVPPYMRVIHALPARCTVKHHCVRANSAGALFPPTTTQRDVSRTLPSSCHLKPPRRYNINVLAG